MALTLILLLPHSFAADAGDRADRFFGRRVGSPTSHPFRAGCRTNVYDLSAVGAHVGKAALHEVEGVHETGLDALLDHVIVMSSRLISPMMRWASLTRISIVPNALAAVDIAASASALTQRRSTTTATRAPSRASTSAIPRPIPWQASVTIAAFPSSLPILSLPHATRVEPRWLLFEPVSS